MAGKKPKLNYQADMSKYLAQMMGDPTGKELAESYLKNIGYFNNFSNSIAKVSKGAAKNVAANYQTSIDDLIGATEQGIDEMSKKTNVSLGRMLDSTVAQVRRSKSLIQKELAGAFVAPKIDTSSWKKTLNVGSSGAGGIGAKASGGMMENLGGMAKNFLVDKAGALAEGAVGAVFAMAIQEMSRLQSASSEMFRSFGVTNNVTLPLMNNVILPLVVPV
jgi:hypothetical protein